MNYSYFCKNCGYTAFTEDKLEVRALREAHRPLIGGVRQGCRGLRQLSDGTIMREDLTKELGIPEQR